MLPKIPIIRLADSIDLPLPDYADGIGTSIVLKAAVSAPLKIGADDFMTIPTGFAIALPLGLEAQVRSLKESANNGVVVLNAPATIDASDREEIKVTLLNASHNAVIIRRGQPIALLVFSEALRVQWDEISLKKQKDYVDEEIARYEEQTIHQEEIKDPLEMPSKPAALAEEMAMPPLVEMGEDFSEDRIQQIQKQADAELEQLEEISLDNIPTSHSEDAFLVKRTPEEQEAYERANGIGDEMPSLEAQISIREIGNESNYVSAFSADETASLLEEKNKIEPSAAPLSIQEEAENVPDTSEAPLPLGENDVFNETPQEEEELQVKAPFIPPAVPPLEEE